MAKLVPGTPFRSREPKLVVENELAPGTYVFALTVVNDKGTESAPFNLSVAVIAAPNRPPT